MKPWRLEMKRKYLNGISLTNHGNGLNGNLILNNRDLYVYLVNVNIEENNMVLASFPFPLLTIAFYAFVLLDSRAFRASRFHLPLSFEHLPRRLENRLLLATNVLV